MDSAGKLLVEFEDIEKALMHFRYSEKKESLAVEWFSKTAKAGCHKAKQRKAIA